MFIEYEILFIADKRPIHVIGLSEEFCYKFEPDVKNKAINKPIIWIKDVR